MSDPITNDAAPSDPVAATETKATPSDKKRRRKRLNHATIRPKVETAVGGVFEGGTPTSTAEQ